MQLDTYLVTALPDFAPRPDSLEEARAFLNAADVARYVHVTLYPNRRAIGSLEGLSTVTCPECSTVLQFWSDDLDEWQSNLQDILFSADKPMSIAVAMPCCRRRTLLGGINFRGAVRYSRLGIVLSDMFVDSVGEAIVARLESILGCRLVQFSAGST